MKYGALRSGLRIVEKIGEFAISPIWQAAKRSCRSGGTAWEGWFAALDVGIGS